MRNPTLATAPVTPELLAVLIDTEKFLAQYNDENARLNDAAHYGAAAIQLEALVKAIMTARTSVSLLGRPAIGARFHVGAQSGLIRAVDNASVYLSNQANNLLRHKGGALSRYEKTHTETALSLLSELMSRFTDDVQNVSRTDLGRIRSKSVELLMATADVVAKIESGDAAALSDYAKAAVEPAQDVDRCTVVSVNDKRCTKPADHRPSGSEDAHKFTF
jgi:hypothetical protein